MFSQRYQAVHVGYKGFLPGFQIRTSAFRCPLREFEADDGIISPLQLATDAEYAGIYDPETDWIVSLGVRGETRIYSPDENDGNAYKT